MRYVIHEEKDAWDYYATVVILDDENNVVDEVGWFGGEPEDNTHYRDYVWVVPALNDAYLRGIEEGLRRANLG